jgi:hypothetical protein
VPLARSQGRRPRDRNLLLCRWRAQTKRESRVAQYRGNVFDRAVYLIPNYRALEDPELHDVCHWDAACLHDVCPVFAGTNGKTRSIDGTATRAVTPDVDCRMSLNYETYSGETHTVRHTCADSSYRSSGRLLATIVSTSQSSRLQVAATQSIVPSLTANCKPTPSRPYMTVGAYAPHCYL